MVESSGRGVVDGPEGGDAGAAESCDVGGIEYFEVGLAAEAFGMKHFERLDHFGRDRPPLPAHRVLLLLGEPVCSNLRQVFFAGGERVAIKTDNHNLLRFER